MSYKEEDERSPVHHKKKVVEKRKAMYKSDLQKRCFPYVNSPQKKNERVLTKIHHTCTDFDLVTRQLFQEEPNTIKSNTLVQSRYQEQKIRCGLMI